MSKIALRSWFYFIFRLINTKHGIYSSTNVARELEMTLKTAWKMGHQIRTIIDKKESKIII